MPPYAGPPVPRYGDAAGTLRLLGWLALAIALIVLDHRGGWLSKARTQATLAVQPLWRLAALPSEIGAELRSGAATRTQLQRENEVLRNALLVSGARLARLPPGRGVGRDAPRRLVRSGFPGSCLHLDKIIGNRSCSRTSSLRPIGRTSRSFVPARLPRQHDLRIFSITSNRRD